MVAIDLARPEVFVIPDDGDAFFAVLQHLVDAIFIAAADEERGVLVADPNVATPDDPAAYMRVVWRFAVGNYDAYVDATAARGDTVLDYEPYMLWANIIMVMVSMLYGVQPHIDMIQPCLDVGVRAQRGSVREAVADAIGTSVDAVPGKEPGTRRPAALTQPELSDEGGDVALETPQPEPEVQPAPAPESAQDKAALKSQSQPVPEAQSKSAPESQPVTPAAPSTQEPSPETRERESAERVRRLRRGEQLAPTETKRVRFASDMELRPAPGLDTKTHEVSTMEPAKAQEYLTGLSRVNNVSEALLNAATERVSDELAERGYNFTSLPANRLVNTLLYLLCDIGTIDGVIVSDHDAALYQAVVAVLNGTSSVDVTKRGNNSVLQEISDMLAAMERTMHAHGTQIAAARDNSHTAATVAAMSLANTFNMTDVVPIGMRSDGADAGAQAVQKFTNKLMEQDQRVYTEQRVIEAQKESRKHNKRKRS
mgnify:CR=1 FL=1